MVATAGLALVTRPDFPAKDLAGTVAAIKASPGKFNFGSAGAGTTQQFSGELMKQLAGLDMRHVPYRSTPAVLAGLLSGDVEMVFELIQTIQGQVGTGALKAIAVTLPQRNPVLPNVPTFAESGMPGGTTSRAGTGSPCRHAARDRAEDEQGDGGRACARGLCATRFSNWARRSTARRLQSSRPISPARSRNGKQSARRPASSSSSVHLICRSSRQPVPDARGASSCCRTIRGKLYGQCECDLDLRLFAQGLLQCDGPARASRACARRHDHHARTGLFGIPAR